MTHNAKSRSRQKRVGGAITRKVKRSNQTNGARSETEVKEVQSEAGKYNMASAAILQAAWNAGGKVV